MYKPKHFELYELLPPDLYQALKEQEGKGWRLFDDRLLRTLDKLKEVFPKGGITINNYFWGGNRRWSGLRTPGSPYYSITSQHCFDEQTEILTTDGWVSIDEEFTDDVEVVTLNTATDEVENKPISNRTEFNYSGIAYGIQTKHVDSLTTDNHRNYVASGPQGKFKFEYSKDISSKRRFMKRKGNNQNNDKLTAIEKLAIATVCDGAIKNNNIHFHLKKKRKIQRILDLAKELDSYFNCYEDKLKEDTYYLTIPSDIAKQVISIIHRNKSLEFALPLVTKAKSIVDEYTFYDGNIDKRESTNCRSISSVDKKNIDILSALCVHAGYSHVVSEYELDTEFSIEVKPIYTIHITENSVTRVNKEKYYTTEYSGRMWCLSNDNTTLFVRRNGKVSVSGNSYGRAIDCVFSAYDEAEVRAYVIANPDEFPFVKGVENFKGQTWCHLDVRNADEMQVFEG